MTEAWAPFTPWGCLTLLLWPAPLPFTGTPLLSLPKQHENSCPVSAPQITSTLQKLLQFPLLRVWGASPAFLSQPGFVP